MTTITREKAKGRGRGGFQTRPQKITGKRGETERGSWVVADENPQSAFRNPKLR
jgi:NADH:ubiquinone oxidoreductase subunit F (NADH-binding)